MQASPGQASLLLAKVTVFSPFFIFALDLLSKGSRSAAPNRSVRLGQLGKLLLERLNFFARVQRSLSLPFTLSLSQ